MAVSSTSNVSAVARLRPSTRRAPTSRLVGVDLARALAMLGMLIEHTLQYPTVQPKGVLWTVYGRSAPVFVLLAGVGLSLATRAPGRPLDRALIAARMPLLLLVGMALSLGGDGVILQSFALFFAIGLAAVNLSRRALATAAGVCLVGGPLFLTVLRRHDALTYFGSRTDVGFHALLDPVALARGLSVSYYPAVIWMGFFFVGMLLGRGDLSSAAVGRRLFTWATAAAVLVFTLGWLGARTFAPTSPSFTVAPTSPVTWSQHWTTYGFSNSIGWALSSTAVAIALVGACIWATAVVRRPQQVLAPVLEPLVALGAVPMSFYGLHFVYLGTAWPRLLPYLTNTTAFFAVSVAFWFVFAIGAERWTARFRRGPIEAALHAAAVGITTAITGPWRLRRARPATVIAVAHPGPPPSPPPEHRPAA